jgi:cyclopropane-fatty-acyl-phospholipid synthase
MSPRREMLKALCSRLGEDPPPLRLVFSDGDSFDFVPEPKVTIRLRSRGLLVALTRGNFDPLAKAYIRGDLVVEGRLGEVIQTGIALAERLEKLPVLHFLARLTFAIPRVRSRRADASDVRHHYDVSNEFYGLWLDERMIYSCAYFYDGQEDIDAAQAQKLGHICRKLRLKPRERLLDVGCGWGGLLRWAADHHQATGLGVTLSERQYDYARELLADSDIEIRLQDYRDVREAAFDKIVSVGMYEHVGSRNLPAYFRKVSDLLRPGGAFLNQGIVATDPRGGAQGPVGGGFIDKYVFPGGAVSHVSRIIAEATQAGLDVIDVEDLRPHYVRTLESWSQRLEARREEAVRIAGAERYRIWTVYLAGMAEAFHRGWLSVAQVLAYKSTKAGLASRPWTRDYQYSGNMDPACND